MKKVHRRLTFEELRAFPGFENFTDEQAEETIKSLEALSILFYGGLFIIMHLVIMGISKLVEILLSKN